MSVYVGTPVAAIYQDNPNTNEGRIIVCLPGSKFGITRTVTGATLAIRSKQAGVAIAGLVGNFIENNPAVAKVEGRIIDTAGLYSFDMGNPAHIEAAKEPAKKKAKAEPESVKSPDAPRPPMSEQEV